jgi:hypothetical protein
MNSLQTIQDDFLEALEVAIEYQENGEEIPEEIIEALEVKEDEFAVKALNYSSIINLGKVNLDYLKEHRKKSMLDSKSIEKKVAYLKASLLKAVLLFGEDRKLTKTQKEKGLSRAGKQYKILNEDGKVTLSETIKQEFVFNSDSLEEKDYEVTIELNGSNLEKLRSLGISFELKAQKLNDKPIIERWFKDQGVLKSINEDLESGNYADDKERRVLEDMRERLLAESKVKEVNEVSSLRIS